MLRDPLDDLAAETGRRGDAARDFSADFAHAVLSLRDWLALDLPAPTYLMGQWLTTTSRAMIVAATGLGKTNFCLALAFAVAAGQQFLHWFGGRPARVLYVDGEMSSRLMRARLIDAGRRAGAEPDGIFVLCRDNVESLEPLNTPAGQAFVDQTIAQVGGVDLVIFDNVMSLISGDMKDEEGWSQTLPWAKTLTKRGIGQVWVHHTGHDKTRSYGTSTREWQLDTVIVLEAAERPDTDIAFNLQFRKARERTPENRDDFADAIVTLERDCWRTEGLGRESGHAQEGLA